MKQKTIKYWDENLQYLVEQIIRGKCPKEDIPRHCHDFLLKYREVIAKEIVGV